MPPLWDAHYRLGQRASRWTPKHQYGAVGRVCLGPGWPPGGAAGGGQRLGCQGGVELTEAISWPVRSDPPAASVGMGRATTGS
jgi:hypothetical protein